jgi:hypothetical protein
MIYIKAVISYSGAPAKLMHNYLVRMVNDYLIAIIVYKPAAREILTVPTGFDAPNPVGLTPISIKVPGEKLAPRLTGLHTKAFLESFPMRRLLSRSALWRKR